MFPTVLHYDQGFYFETKSRMWGVVTLWLLTFGSGYKQNGWSWVSSQTLDLLRISSWSPPDLLWSSSAGAQVRWRPPHPALWPLTGFTRSWSSPRTSSSAGQMWTVRIRSRCSLRFDSITTWNSAPAALCLLLFHLHQILIVIGTNVVFAELYKTAQHDETRFRTFQDRVK